MKIFKKEKIYKDDRIIKNYKCMGITLLSKEKTPIKRKYSILGIEICHKRKKCLNFFQQYQEISHSDFPQADPLNLKKIAIIGELSLPQCKLYRVTNKIKALESLGYTIEISFWQDMAKSFEIMQTAAFVIFYRIPFFKDVEKYYKEADRLGIKKVFDIDDLIFDKAEYAAYLENKQFPLSQKAKDELLWGSDLYKKALEASDAFWASTKTLAKAARKKVPLISLVPNVIPETLEKISEIRQWTKSSLTQTVKIFYGSGSNTHDDDFIMCVKALNDVLNKYNNVELYIQGSLKIEGLNETASKKVKRLDFINAEDYYFSISEYDIALAPLEKNVFCESKSNIKYIEASMFEIPSITSDLYEFSSVIENGKNGFIAKTYEDWKNALCLLIENKELRKQIGQAARKNVISRYNLAQNAANIAKAIEKLNLPVPQKTKKVLYVNVLYGYSSLGGATIVTEQIAEEMNKNYADYQSYVFTCHISKVPNDLVRYDYNGVHVFSISVGQINLSYQNEEIERVFAKLLKQIKPDIVHFHSIQTMGAQMMTICHNANIPFVVTMHDAWFSCPRQFMLDRNDEFCNQQKLNPIICQARCGISTAEFFHRKQYMYDNLKYAKCIYTPSASFCAQIGNNFPFAKLKCNINGIDLISKQSYKNTNAKDKLVFGFFGGKNSVKGYYLVKEIFNNLQRGDWKLVLTDTTRKFGLNEISKKEWLGDVEILGYIEHKNMVELYNKIDVLLFPSEWNESFGLMIREAIANNVFVISSDCGGPSSAVINKENGLIFPKKDKEAFLDCLNYVFAHKQDIKNYQTKNYGDIRTYKEQVSELHQEYEKILKAG